MIPTAVECLFECPVFNDLSLSNLPCFGSRAAIAGWYSLMDDALRASDWPKVLRLYRAALCVPLRLRCAPSLTQVSRDSMTYSEELFAANPHCSDVFLTFAEKFMAAVPPGFVQCETVKKIVARARTLCISFHGSAVGDGVARALINVAPFLTSPEFRKAFKSFEAISPALNDHTKLSSLTYACTKTYGKAGRAAAAEASVAVLDTLRAGLLYKDITESQLTKEFITGLPNKGGFVHSIFQRIALVDFVQLIVHNSHGKAFADEAKEKIFTKLSSVAAMEEHLAGQFTHAGSSGVEQVLPRVRRATFGRLTSAVGEIDEDEPEPERLTGVGLSFATMIGFGNFSESLSYSGRLLATLLWKTHGYAFDEEFRHIAALEKLNGPQYPFSWRDLFSPLPLHTLGYLSLPLLRDACGAWIQSTMSQPILGVLDEAKFGDEDQASSNACQNNGSNFAAKREITNNALEELFRDRVMLSSMPRAMFTHHNIMQVLQQCRHDWPIVRGNAETNVASSSAVGDGTTGVKSNVASPSAVGDGGTGVPSIEQEKNCTMYLCCAELFPDHAILTCDTFRGIPPYCGSYFKETVKLLLVLAEDDDVVIVSDGRSDVIQGELRSIFRTMAGPDDFVELWVIYDQHGKDVRNPKRKLPWSSQNMESLFVKLPKNRHKLVSRGLFNNCGESTNCSRSFTGVPFRNLAEIPRLTPNAKTLILGKAAVGACDDDRVVKEVLERGHPLFWGEWKPVTLYSTLIHDFQIDHVVDLTPGSGAACLASLYSKVLYTGIAFNEKHEEWLRHLLRRMFVAMVMSNHVVADAGLVQNVTTYLNYSPEVAKCMLPKFAAAFGDSFTGVDDSDGE